MDLNKNSNETELQYIWRLCSAKDSGVLDMTWDELADTLNKNLREDESEYYGSSATGRNTKWQSNFVMMFSQKWNLLNIKTNLLT